MHRSVRHHRPRPRRRSTRCSRESDLLVIGAPHTVYRDLDVPTCRSSTSGTCAATGCRCDRPSPRVSVVIPVYNEGEAIVALPRPHLRRRHAAVRGARGLRHDADDTTVPLPREVRRGATPGSCPTHNTYGRGPARAIRYGIDHAARRSSSSPWPTAATTPSRSTSSCKPGRARRGRGRGVALHARRPAGRRPGR